MADDVTLPGTGAVIATDDVSGKQYQRVKIDIGADGVGVPVIGGQLASSASIPVVLSIGQEAEIGGLTETAPATDTASSGINGRLQRIAQRLSTLITNLAANRVTTPSWTSGTAVIAIQMLAKGAVPLRGTLSLVGKRGGYLHIFIMRSGTTALDVAIDVNVRRLVQTSPQMHGSPMFSASSEKIAAVQGVAAASGNGAGVTSLTLNAAKTFVANSTGYIYLGVIDNTTTPTLASEVLRQVLATSTTVKLLEWPTESAHNNTAHVVADQANVWDVWIDGGETIEVNINYGTATTGDSVCCGAYFSSYDNDGSI